MSELIITIVTSAVVASIVGPLVNDALRIRRDRPSERLSALSAAVTLEGYALTCADKVSDHKTALDSDGHAGSLLGAVPELPEIQVSAALLKPNRVRVANELAAFPQEVRQGDQAAAFWWEVVGDMGSTRNEAVRQTARMGLRALEIARSLRQVFQLPARELKFGDYNVQDALEEEAKWEAE